MDDRIAEFLCLPCKNGQAYTLSNADNAVYDSFAHSGSVHRMIMNAKDSDRYTISATFSKKANQQGACGVSSSRLSGQRVEGAVVKNGKTLTTPTYESDPTRPGS